MQRVLGITIFSLGVILPSVAPAQTQPRPPKAEPQRVQRFDFENDKVIGTLVRPDGDIVDGHGKARHPSLVQARKSFVPEMIKSARDF